MSEDRIYADENTGNEPFRFDEGVARVFPDMLERSIPGYAASLEAIGSLSARFVQAHTRCFDLGCSLGAATLAMRQGMRVPGCTIVAIDDSAAMIERCREIIAAACSATPDAAAVDVRLGKLEDAEIDTASMVVLNYTLQFVAPEARTAVLQKSSTACCRAACSCYPKKSSTRTRKWNRC